MASPAIAGAILVLVLEGPRAFDLGFRQTYSGQWQ